MFTEYRFDESIPETTKTLARTLASWCDYKGIAPEGIQKLIDHWMKRNGMLEEEALEYANELFENGTIDQLIKLFKPKEVKR